MYIYNHIYNYIYIHIYIKQNKGTRFKYLAEHVDLEHLEILKHSRKNINFLQETILDVGYSPVSDKT